MLPSRPSHTGSPTSTKPNSPAPPAADCWNSPGKTLVRTPTARARRSDRPFARRGPEAGRSNALDRLGLAEVYFLGGDLTAGCQETHAALDAERVRSGRVREGMAWLYSYTVGHGASRPVREARARLREQLAD
ncbi:hypothetical protein ACIRQP_02110 [Streptomyces sp. NPDC102274]|uniref:hypothetical protein n=1 Tax=Streptomyces sp. NPDC102274 TaxID=3366151 RepID=UPI00381435E6